MPGRRVKRPTGPAFSGLNGLDRAEMTGSSSSSRSSSSTRHAPAGPPLPLSRCPHVGQAVHMPALKKSLKVSFVRLGVCQACQREAKQAAQGRVPPVGGKGADPAASGATEERRVVLCLRCGHQFCPHHLRVHFENATTDLHCIGMTIQEDWPLRCHRCCAEIPVDSYKKVREAVQFVRKVERVKGRAAPLAHNVPPRSASVKSLVVGKRGDAPLTTIPKPRGLANLGNTCFFNSVMQSLTQSHPLTHILDQHSQKGALFHVPAVAWQSGDRDGPPEPPLEPMSLRLLEAGPITLALTAFFKDMNSMGKTGVMNSGHLFGQVCRRSPQFRGFHQQDAHELLRHLMDGLRTEEVKRQKTAILKHFGLSEKTDPKTVQGKVKRKLQALGRHSNYTVVDKIFGGHLVSTIVCEQCQNSSQIYEPFLDLSLPLVEEKPARPSGSKKKSILNTDMDEDETISCFGRSKKGASDNPVKKISKKERERMKREKRINRKNKKSNGIDPAPGSGNDNDIDGVSDLKSLSSKPEPNEGKDGLLAVVPENESKSEADDVSEKDKNEIKSEEDNAPASYEVQTEENHKPKEAADTHPAIVVHQSVNQKASQFESQEDKAKKSSKQATDGNEEDDEEEDGEDGYSEENEDWTWDYGEEWEEGDGSEEMKKTLDKDTENESDYLQAPGDEENEDEGVTKPAKINQPRRSLNPLPPERMERGSSREKSSELMDDEENPSNVGSGEESDEEETGASVNGDIEDNLEDANPKTILDLKSPVKRLSLKANDAMWSNLKHLEPFHPNPGHLDPHMEQLCKRVRKLSVASMAVPDAIGEKVVNSSQPNEYLLSDDESLQEENDKCRIRLRNEWVARSLTSISPRYHSAAGECSVYSSLTQFTAPELLTGNNKWACDKCTKIQGALKQLKGDTCKSSESSDNNECDYANPVDVNSNVNNTNSYNTKNHNSDQNDSPSKFPTVYSNASKQLLIYSPPAVLTIQLKRFQQTMYNLRKVNRSVQFPSVLDLAPFCASTAVSTSTVAADAKEILYNLFAVVEHKGRLSDGHYTSFVRVRPANLDKVDYSKFHSAPITKTEEIHTLLAEIERKRQLLAGDHSTESEGCQKELSLNSESVSENGTSSADLPADDVINNSSSCGNIDSSSNRPKVSHEVPSKWYHISDSQVSEVSEDKVLRCQAYLLFYERFK